MAVPAASSEISASSELHSALQLLMSEPRAELDRAASDIGVVVDTEHLESSGSDSQSTNKRSRVRDPKEQQRVPLAAKRQRPQRIPTYYMRKEEKATLESQLQVLEAQLEELNRESPVPPLGLPRPKALQKHQRALKQKQSENAVARDAVQGFQLSLAGIQSAVGGHLSSQSQLPFQSHIRLGTDWSERDAALLAMKDKKLHSAQQYFAERTRFLDRSAHFVESSRFKTPEGHLRTIRFDIIPFDGITSVKQVFDALLFYFFNMEISISEVLGDITVREDDGIRQQGVSQNRFISNVREDLQVEINTAMFCHLYEANSQEDFGGGEGARSEVGVIVADFVDEDELYPYSPATRLRHDVTGSIRLSLESRKKEDDDSDEEELVVVMTRVASLSLRRTQLPIPAHEMQELLESVESWGDAMLKTVQGIVYPQRTSMLARDDEPQRRTTRASAKEQQQQQQQSNDEEEEHAPVAPVSDELHAALQRLLSEARHRQHMMPQIPVDNSPHAQRQYEAQAGSESENDAYSTGDHAVAAVLECNGDTVECEQEQVSDDSSSLLLLHETSGSSDQEDYGQEEEEEEEASSVPKKRDRQQQQRQSAIALVRKRMRTAPDEPSDSNAVVVDPKLLETQIASLQSGRNLLPSSPMKSSSSLQSHLHAILRRQMENEALRQGVMHNELQQSAFRGRLITPAQMPFESPIRLGSNWGERQATLLAMRDQKLQSAYRYVTERTRNLDLCTPFSESSRFISRSGELCMLQCDVVPFEGVTSAKTVFDAVLFYLFNMEISVSEVLGDITIREDDGTRLFQGISQNRLFSNVRDKVQVEINSAMFCSLFQAGELGNNEREVGVLIADFVNDDALYPYSPSTRLRHDITATSRITLEPRKRVNAIGEQEIEFIVVLTRIASLSLHPTELPIPDHQMHELRVTVENWGDAMLKTVHGVVYPMRDQLSSKVGQPPMVPAAPPVSVSAKAQSEPIEITTSALTEYVL